MQGCIETGSIRVSLSLSLSVSMSLLSLVLQSGLGDIGAHQKAVSSQKKVFSGPPPSALFLTHEHPGLIQNEGPTPPPLHCLANPSQAGTSQWPLLKTHLALQPHLGVESAELGPYGILQQAPCSFFLSISSFHVLSLHLSIYFPLSLVSFFSLLMSASYVFLLSLHLRLLFSSSLCSLSLAISHKRFQTRVLTQNYDQQLQSHQVFLSQNFKPLFTANWQERHLQPRTKTMVSMLPIRWAKSISHFKALLLSALFLIVFSFSLQSHWLVASQRKVSKVTLASRATCMFRSADVQLSLPRQMLQSTTAPPRAKPEGGVPEPTSLRPLALQPLMVLIGTPSFQNSDVSDMRGPERLQV